MSTLLEGLNPEQLRAVTHGEGPLLIVAGAGTGKTSVIARRIAWLIESGKARPEEILALTFTEKAASELEERIDHLLPIGYVELWALTFHGFGERALRERGIDIGLPADARLLDETGAWLSVRDRLTDFGLEYYRPLGDPSRFIHDLLDHFSHAKDEVVTPAQYRAYAEALEAEPDEKARVLEIAKAFEVYEKLLLDRKQLDFGALISETIRLFRERPTVLADFRKRFKYVLVDEFQDTNVAQYELVKLLAGSEGNLTVVGDDDQSIYKFRGASVSNILAFKDDFPKSSQVFLTRNYRSKQEILDVSYRFIKRNDPNRLEAKLGLSKRLTAERGSGAKIVHANLPDVDDEARYVADEIIRLKESDPDAGWGDFAILARANAHLKPFMEALGRRGVPHLYVASKGLYLKSVIQDAICYFKLLDNYHESPALHRVLAWPVFGLPALDLVKLTHEADRRSWSLYEALRKADDLGFSPETIAKLRRVLALIEKHVERARKTTPARLLKEIFVDTGYYEELLREETPQTLEAIGYLNQLVRRIQAYELDEQRPSLRGFMRVLEWELESGEEGRVPSELSEGPDTVKLMTAHTSKGLEFKNVFIVQLVSRRFPGDNRRETIPFPDALVKEVLNEGSDAHIEEERRLFYVACTRAKDRLYLTAAEDTGGTKKKKPSRFIDEIFADEDNKKAIEVLAQTKKSRFDEPESDVSGQVSDVVLELPSSFSFSQLAAFGNCPLQYKFAHLLKIPTLDKGTLNYGKLIHSVLETFIEGLKAGKTMTLDELLAIYESGWTGEWYEDAEERDRYHQAGIEAVTRGHARTLVEKPTPWMTEAPFTLKIGKYVMKGKIDRIDRMPDGTAMIIDYKTGKSKERLDAGMKLQLRIYQLAVADVYQAKTSRMAFWFLKDDEMQEVEPAEDLDAIRVELEAEIAALEASDFAPTPSAHTCKYCDFKDICRFKVL
jgi:DNA helicase-2/ATP-dependent DNA helicase PcrA